MIVTIDSLFLATLSEIWAPAFSRLSIQLLCFYSVLYFKLWQTKAEEVFLCCISAAFSNSSLVLYRYGSAPASICAENLEAVHQGFPVIHLCSTIWVAVNRAGSISGEDKDVVLYSEWLAGKPILRNTVGMSHQNTCVDRDIHIELPFIQLLSNGVSAYYLKLGSVFII